MDRPLKRAWWQSGARTRVVLTTIAVLLVLATGGVFLRSSDRSLRLDVNRVSISTVQPGTFHDFVPIVGKIVPVNTVYLDALEGGRVERLLAVAGDSVAQGQPLVELSNTELELDVLDREGRLIESLTQLQSYRTQLEQNRINNQKALARIEYDIIRLRRSLVRRDSLVAKGMEPAELRDSLQDELSYNLKLQPMQEESNREQEDLRVQQLPPIRSQLDKLRQDLEITHGKLDNLTVRAPVAGVLTSLDLKVGENRNRGERFGQITPNAGVKISVAVDEYYLGRVHVGQKGQILLRDATWSLEVQRVYPEVKNGTFDIDLTFVNASPGGLFPGQAVQGKLTLGGDSNALILSSGAFLETTGGDWIFVVTPDGSSAQRRRIRVGRRNAEQVEILGGLSGGERVVTSSYSGFERLDRIDFTR